MSRIRSSRRLVSLAGCLSVVALGGCPPGPRPAGQPSLDQFAADVQAAVCAWAIGCHMVVDTTACQAYLDFDASLAPIRASITAGRMTYNADQAAACLDAMRAMTCNLAGSFVGSGIESACATVFAGTVATSGTCYQSQDCVAGDACDPPAGCSPSTMCCAGTCVVSGTPGPVPIGGACTGSFNECVAGAYCLFGTTGGTCAAQAAAGQPCSGFDSCVAGTTCLSGSCRVMVDTGQACGPTAPCARVDNYCDPSSLICVMLPIEGQPCTGGGQCVQYAYCDAGTCRVRPVAGQACTTASGCQFTSFCPASGVCEAPTSQPVCP